MVLACLDTTQEEKIDFLMSFNMKIIKFTAMWCADCIVMRPMWAEISDKHPNLEIIEYDFDKNPTEIKHWEVKKVPHLIIINQDGKELTRVDGLRSKNELTKIIEDYLIL